MPCKSVPEAAIRANMRKAWLTNFLQDFSSAGDNLPASPTIIM
jgi:hypothetical protein